MRKLLAALTVLSLPFLSSCMKKKEFIYEADCDYHEWTNMYTVKTVPNPHSGVRVSCIDSTHEYSLGFSKTIANISDKKLKQVKLSYWVFITSDKAKATSVISIDFQGKNNYWDGRPVKGTLNTWVQVEEIFKIPENTDSNNQLSLYVWNNSKEEILIDDINIVFK